MATITRYIDDVTGKEIPEDEGGPVVFSLQGEFYQLDISNDTLAKLEKVLAPYMDKAVSVENPAYEEVNAPARRPGRGRAAVRVVSSGRAGTGSGLSKEELADAREWLRGQGHEVSERGRIKGDLLDMYLAAQPR